MDKTCSGCGEAKPRTEFYPLPRMRDGLTGKCKECTKRVVRRYAAEKAKDPAWVEAQRKRGREKYHRLYRPEKPMPFWIADIAAATKRWAAKALSNAVRDGRIKRPSKCAKCGNGHRRGIHGHHEDYSKPFEVVWLCPKCHRARHAEKSETRSVQGYNAPIGQRPKEAL